MSALKFDLMDIADIGGQARKLAVEIHRQMRAQTGELMLPMPLKEIGEALGITEVVERATTTFEGMLVTSPDKSQGAIVLRKGLKRGRRNFTWGHEIGHFVNPYHKAPPAGFVCSQPGLRAQRAGTIPFRERSTYDRMEVEANEFSQALLVPLPEYRRERSKLSGCDLMHITPLANRFGISKEAMARIYVDTASDKIGILTSRNGRLERFILPPKFPYLGLTKNHPLPMKSHTDATLRTGQVGHVTALAPIAADTWLEKSARGIELFEQTMLQQDGWAMTLLLVEAPDEADEEESDAVDGNWSAPKFAYGR